MLVHEDFEPARNEPVLSVSKGDVEHSRFSQPSLLPGQSVSLNSIPYAQLSDRFG